MGRLTACLASAALVTFSLAGCASGHGSGRGFWPVASAPNTVAPVPEASQTVDQVNSLPASFPEQPPRIPWPPDQPPPNSWQQSAIPPPNQPAAPATRVARWRDGTQQEYQQEYQQSDPRPPPPTGRGSATSPDLRAEELPPVGPELVAPQLGPGRIEIPLGPPMPAGRVQADGPLVTVTVREAPLHSVLSLIAQQQGLSIVSPGDLKTPVTVTLQATTLKNALDAVMAVSGCTWTRINNVIYVTPISKETPENFLVQGREMRVFSLSYVAANDVEKVVTGLLSPVGKSFARQIDSKDKRKALEQIVVEDLPPYVARIADYIAQADYPPRQVMVEARLLQVKLENDNRHGVNFDALARLAGANVSFKTQAFASGVGPAAIFTVDGTDFNSLIDYLATTNDSKTLAAPKLLMINGQESKIQIGRRLGYFVTTTTQTSTLQDVQFLEVGVVLTVTPQITADGHVVMKVRPKVSTGEINPTTTLPEEETTEVDTSIMVPDGHGVIIGGLIQETDNERQSKTPFLGDIWLVGRLFQRRAVERERSEVVVALLPRIVPQDACPTPVELFDLQRVESPLVTPTLQSAPRPEPRMRDAASRPTRPWWAPTPAN